MESWFGKLVLSFAIERITDYIKKVRTKNAELQKFKDELAPKIENLKKVEGKEAIDSAIDDVLSHF